LRTSKKILLLLLVMIAGILSTSCQKSPSTSNLSITPTGEGFAIYLTADDVPVTQMEYLSHVILQNEPLFSAVEIDSYDWAKHRISLTDTGQAKLADFEVPISGISFMVCVDKCPVYWGAFYNPLSSYYPFGTPVISMFPGDRESIKIEWDQVSGNVEELADPRNDPSIFESLKNWDKLVQ
jgi:hypothetical protein